MTTSTVRDQVRHTIKIATSPLPQPQEDALVDALTRLVEEAEPCAECVTFHSFHASDPFDALTAKAP